MIRKMYEQSGYKDGRTNTREARRAVLGAQEALISGQTKALYFIRASVLLNLLPFEDPIWAREGHGKDTRALPPETGQQ